MKNVIKRFDSIAISPKKIEAPKVEVEQVTTKAVRQDDTPPLGSLGGQLPKALYVPKVKAPKIKRKKLAPGQMKIFDSEGREWGRRNWKEVPSETTI